MLVVVGWWQGSRRPGGDAQIAVDNGRGIG
jgi:hypothetical protein